MGNERWRAVLASILASVALAGVAHAGNDGLVFRALGFYQGKADISEDTITCEIPTVSAAFSDNAYTMGLWNSFGVPTQSFPDINNGFADPCGGWIQLANNQLGQGINVEKINLKLRIAGANRLRDMVPTRKSFPLACRQFAKAVIFGGARLNPLGSPVSSSNSGAPNVAFIQLVPMVSPQLINCLRSQYTSLSTDVLSSIPLVINARAMGRGDNGDKFFTNTISYTLTLRHVCGNGRVDDGELCDPNAPNTCLLGACEDGTCAGDDRFACASSADCVGTCQPAGVPSECVCVY